MVTASAQRPDRLAWMTTNCAMSPIDAARTS